MKLDEVKKGGKDQRDREILDVLWTTKDYVIYQHPGGISPHFSDDDDTSLRQRAAYAKIGPLLSGVNALRSGTYLRGTSVDREIARAIMQSLEGDLSSAERTLAIVGARLQNLRTIEGRLQYQISSLVAVTVVGLLCVLVPLALGYADQSPLSSRRLALVCGFGAIGGFLSVSVGINKLRIDPDADWKINAISGASRIVIAVVGSLFVYLAIVAKLILGTLFITDSDAGILTISMVAGFSETLVPNILSRLARDAGERQAASPQSDQLQSDRTAHISRLGSEAAPNPALQGTRDNAARP